MRKTSIKLIAAVAAVGLVFAACAEDEPAATRTDTAAPAGTDAPAGTRGTGGVGGSRRLDAASRHRSADRHGAPTGTEAATRGADGEFSQEEIDQWGIDYTGATPGEASGEPFKIGYVNQEAVFPENTVGIKPPSSTSTPNSAVSAVAPVNSSRAR